MRLPRLVYLQYIRAIAAFAVVFYHMGYYGNLLAGFSSFGQVFTGYFGYFGVVAFFTISGYLMSSLIQETSMARFIAHRVLRIYPIYWILVVIMYILRVAAGTKRALTPSSLLLVPLEKPDGFLSVEWTLVYEVFYYGVTALFCWPLIRRFHVVFLTAWLVLCVAVFRFNYDFSIASPPDMRHIATSMWNIPFLLGGLGYYLLPRVRPNPGWCLGGFALLLASDLYGLYSRALIGPLSCALIVLYLIHKNQETTPQVNRIMLALGDYSYGFYLVHVTVIILGLTYTARLHPRQEALDNSIVLGLCLGAGSAAGALDMWLYRHLKRLADNYLGRSAAVTPIVVTPAAVPPSPGEEPQPVSTQPTIAPGPRKRRS